jgi:glycosyltransferase involved in cell wall biosynthesis
MGRIAYVINSVEGGGAALPVPAIARVLQASGAEVRVFALTRRDGRALPSMMAAGLDPLVRDGGERDHAAALHWLVHETRMWGATHLWTSLSRATILGLLAGPRLGLPVIAWQHAAFLKFWNRRLMRLLQHRARMWVADSPSVALLTTKRLQVPTACLCTWPIFAADPGMPSASPWTPGEPLRIGSLGRLHAVKGYDVLLHTLLQLRRDGFVAPVPIMLTIAGEGAERDRLLALAREHDLPVQLPGYENAPKDFLARQHLYVQPSRSEGFCISVHEAMTAGLPVIASRVGEPALTICEGETGWLADPDDVQALAKCLLDAFATPARLVAMGQAARADMLGRYSQGRFEETGRAIWRQVAGSSAPAQSSGPAASDPPSSRRPA